MKLFRMHGVAVLCLAVGSVAQGAAVTKIWFSDTSHSVTLVHFNSSGPWSHLRIRYIQAPGTCTSGHGGSIEATLYQAGAGQAEPNADMRQPLGGLLPNTTYQVCPEISADNVKWSAGAGATLTTLSLPDPHPARPIPPVTFDTSYPDTSGYESVTVAADCHDLANRLDAALKNQARKGTIIHIPAGTVCSGQYYLRGPAADVVKFQPSAVNVAKSTITLPNHGYSEGQGIIFGTWYGCIMGFASANHCNADGVGEIVPGQLYHAHVVDANTIQVYSGASMASGGKLVKFSNAGSIGTDAWPYHFLEIVRWPRPLHWIIIRTAIPDNQFDPEHVRVNPAWEPKMPVLQLPNLFTGTSLNDTLFSVSDSDTNEMSMNANIRLVGLELTYTRSPDLGSDVVPHGELLETEQWNQNIIADRCWFHSLPPPDRVGRVFWWNGMNMAIVDSYMDNMQFYHPTFSGLQVARKSNTQLTIAPGTYNWGSGKVRATGNISVSLSGANGASAQGLLLFFENSGQLDVVPPPGVTATVAGYNRWHMVKTRGSDVGAAITTTGSGYPGSAPGMDFYFVDPIFSTSATGANSESLFASTQALGGVANVEKAWELGVHFYSDKDGYIDAVRFYKPPSDTAKTHTVFLWKDANQARLASANSTNETTSGWQTARFSPPIAITAGVTYTASFVTQHFLHWDGFFQNLDYANGPLHADGVYQSPTGRLDYSDTWPQNFLAGVNGTRSGHPLVAPVGGATIAGGQVQNVWQADSTTNQYDTEGCQCMVGGIGPGPYAFVNNYVEGSGVVWHHDDSGGYWAKRSDYYYYRNTFYVPLSQMFGGPQSDGMRYFQRQALEWKAGQRILVEGNVFDGGWVEDTPFGEFIDFSSVTGEGIRDVDVRSNTFEHGSSLLLSPTSITGGTLKVAPPIRFRFENNLAWDIDGLKYCTHGQAFCRPDGGFGVLLAGSQGAEDWIVNRNTIVGNKGIKPSLLWMSETRAEAVNFTRNILYLSRGPGEGVATESVLGLSGQNCGELAGKKAADCALQNYVFDHNLLTGADGASEIRSWWPGLQNVVPRNPSDLSVLGSVKSNAVRGQDEFVPNSDLPEEWRGIGVDVKALDAAQGKVRRVNVPASSIGSSSAVITFEAPDSAACPIDYSSSDPTLIQHFTRVNDPGEKLDRGVTLNHLSPNTVYYYRVNCAAEQIKGQFRTQ